VSSKRENEIQDWLKHHNMRENIPSVSSKRENETQDWLKHHNNPFEDTTVRTIGNIVMRTSLSPSPKLIPFFMIMGMSF
jgi:hypothetical protein